MIVRGTVIPDGSVWASVITGELGFIRIHDTNIQSIRISSECVALALPANELGVAAAALGEYTVSTLGKGSLAYVLARNPTIQAFCIYSLREIFACNHLALRKAVRTSHISRNKLGV
jgi:hypothetical protein